MNHNRVLHKVTKRFKHAQLLKAMPIGNYLLDMDYI
jgi:hypothetical protein